jgi:hypothetical protein
VPGSTLTMRAKSQFELITPHRVFVLMAPSDAARQDWVDSFNEVCVCVSLFLLVFVCAAASVLAFVPRSTSSWFSPGW